MSEITIDNEVRIRLLEKIASGIDGRFDKMESKMDSQFHWILGTIFGLIFTLFTLGSGVALHAAKLI